MTKEAKNAIEIEKLTKRYGDLLAVNDISFTVRKGEVFAFLGPNGAGKTTTVEIIETIRTPTSGKVSVLGMDVTKKKRKIVRRIGVLPQGFSSFDRITVRETIEYYSRLFNSRNTDIDGLIELANLQDKSKEQFKNLSGGLKQRLGIAIALVNNPEVIFLDEPTTGLDPRARREVWDVLLDLKKKGKTVFLTTHYMEEAELLADTVAIISKGSIVAMGSPMELIQSNANYLATERQILGKNIIGTIIPEKNTFGRGAKGTLKDIKCHPELYATFENENICKDGRRAWVAWANKAIHNEQKNVTEILCVGHDITERKLMENELQLLVAAVRNSNDAITVQDLKGNIIAWNHGAERIYGYSETEALKMNISRIVPDHKYDIMMSLTAKVLKGENIEFFETQRVTKNNRILDISLTITLLKNENGKPFAITTTERDITEHRLLEKEILDITEKERALIGQEIHDGMGQVLTGIAVKCKGLALKLKSKSSEDMKEALAISKIANQAIGQARDLARMLYPADIETGGLLSALKILASSTEKSMGVTCRFRCGKSVSVKDLVEAKQIYRIVQEAITNAIKHGKPKIINITLRLSRSGTILLIENDGRNFQKLSPRNKGLGLKIMKYRTDLIGGSLDIRKSDKGGTVITCIFPNSR